MALKIAENLRIEVNIPLLNVECFRLHWKVNEHAQLSIEGYIDSKIPYHLEQVYGSRLKVSLEKDEQPLFCGPIMKAELSTVAGMEKISLCAMSGSYLLDQKSSSSSFQSIKKTYSETVKQTIESSGGKVICTIGSEQNLGQPVIQFEETPWEFAKRLASHLGSGIIPDIKTGNPNLWFGMRKGDQIPDFSDMQYTVKIKHNSYGLKANEISYKVRSKEFYKIGDQTRFLGENMIIAEVSANIELGELFFTYVLKRKYVAAPIYQDKFAGLSLPGIILDIKDELIKVALDIDHQVSTGDYFYPWYPKTGNVLYAMPEIGARIGLYFPNVDERNGFITDSFPGNKKKYNYEKRCLALEDGNLIQLFDSFLCFSKGASQSVSLADESVCIGASKQLQITAEGKVRLRAKRIHVNSEDEITIYKS